MENIEAYKEGNKLVIIIDLNAERNGDKRLSSTGKSIMVASQQLKYRNTLDEKITIGINAYKPNPDFNGN
jgi:hypothetical protein